jgi:hypothetical protein
LTKNLTDQETQAILAITEAAWGEFKTQGKVTSVRCDVGGGLIELQWLGSNQKAMSIKCACGRFHGALSRNDSVEHSF